MPYGAWLSACSTVPVPNNKALTLFHSHTSPVTFLPMPPGKSTLKPPYATTQSSQRSQNSIKTLYFCKTVAVCLVIFPLPHLNKSIALLYYAWLCLLLSLQLHSYMATVPRLSPSVSKAQPFYQSKKKNTFKQQPQTCFRRILLSSVKQAPWGPPFFQLEQGIKPGLPLPYFIFFL